MYNKIAIIIPTYGRHDTFLPRCLQSFTATMENKKNVMFIIVARKSDSDSISATNRCLKGYEYHIIKETTSTPHLATYYNMAQKLLKTMGVYHNTILSMIGDDMVMETGGWDEKLLSYIQQTGGHGVFYCVGDERFKNGLCVNLFVTSKMIDPGEFMCRKFAANGIDMVWQLAADACNMDYCIEDIVISHYQCSRDDIGHDDTYKRLSPARKKAIKDKKWEVFYAQEMVRRWIRSGVVDKKSVSKIVPHLRHNRTGRTICRNGRFFTI